uniref:Uncharacterized protein n=1 Tax=uncultured marine virus TaxID=186617 RepID=A0A0F7LAA0_9VIRU|nr:hypothetical protein [uncultured marine virus]
MLMQLMLRLIKLLPSQRLLRPLRIKPRQMLPKQQQMPSRLRQVPVMRLLMLLRLRSQLIRLTLLYRRLLSLLL